MEFWRLLCVNVLVCLVFCSGISTLEMASFTVDTANSPLLAVTMYPDKNMVYVGGKNILLQLDTDLKYIQQIIKEPVIGSSSCGPYVKCENGSPVDNEFKIVEISEKKKYLLVCGTSNQGTCSFHGLDNISNSVQIKGNGVSELVGSRNSSLIYFPPSDTDEFMYVFQEYDGRAFHFSPHVMSLRKLVTENTEYKILYTYLDRELNQISALDILENIKDKYFMQFVYVFKYKNYLYIVMNQQKDVKTSNSIRIKLGRLCLNETLLLSYMELDLECKDGDTMYNFAKTASLSDDILFISAVQSQSSRNRHDQESWSVVCGFKMELVNDIFLQGFYHCLQAHGKSDSTRVDWNNDKNKNCIPDQVCKFKKKKFKCVLYTITLCRPGHLKVPQCNKILWRPRLSILFVTFRYLR